MGWSVTPFTVVGVVSGALSAGLAVVGWRFRSKPYGASFAVLMATLAGWSVAYGVQSGFDTVAGQLLFQRVAIVFAGVIPSVWLVFTARYAGIDGWIDRWTRLALSVEPAAFATLVVTNDAHRLIWDGARFVAGSPVVDLALRPGWFLHVAYGYLLLGTGIFLLGAVALGGSVVYRQQAAFLVAGTLPPTATNVAYTVGASPIPAMDLTPFALTFTGALWGLGLFRFDLLDRAPVAKQRAITDAGDGLVVVDDAGRVVEVTGVASEVFDPTPAVGDDAATLRADGGVTTEQGETDSAHAATAGSGADDDREDGGSETGAFTTDDPGDTLTEARTETDPGATLAPLDGDTRSAVVDGRERTYDLRVSRLTDDRDRETGHVVVCRDVTQREAYQQRLEVANRVLRHNLRNDMNVVVGRAESLADRLATVRAAADDPPIDETAVASAETIRDTGRELLDTSEKAREMLQLRREEPSREPVELTRPTRRVIEEFREEWPAATFTVEVADDVHAVVGSEERYWTALRNLVANAVEHHDGTPTVRVTITDGDPVRVTVADDGPGLSAAERRPFAVGEETQLQHTSGIGLWLVYWVTTDVGGDVTFADREPRGTAVTMRFPSE